MSDAKHTKKTWISCYIYYHESSGDSLLTQKVWSVIQNALRQKWAAQFFFIRYFDKKGSHIRLRFKGKKEILKTKLKPYLSTAFNKYPVRFVKYIPEIKRYGGRIGIIIAEEQFQISSKTVLAILLEDKNWNYERAIETALQLHLGMAHALGIKRKEALEFFKHMANHGDTKIFETHLERQKHDLIPYFISLWNSLVEEKPFEEQWFNIWLVETRQIAGKLNIAYKNHQLQLPDTPSHQINPLWALYESYVHMTNNRLGIDNIDEPYIAYILQKSFEKN